MCSGSMVSFTDNLVISGKFGHHRNNELHRISWKSNTNHLPGVAVAPGMGPGMEKSMHGKPDSEYP